MGNFSTVLLLELQAAVAVAVTSAAAAAAAMVAVQVQTAVELVAVDQVMLQHKFLVFRVQQVTLDMVTLSSKLQMRLPHPIQDHIVKELQYN